MKDLFDWKKYLNEKNKSEAVNFDGYRKYVKKRVLLEEQLDSNWINENIEFLKVNYDVVYSCEISQGTIKKT